MKKTGMKKTGTACFYLALTLTVTAAGFFLPGSLFDYQDQQMTEKVEKTKFKSMEFTYSSSLLDTLKLLSCGYYTVEYPSAGSQRTEKEVWKISLDIIDQLKKYGISVLDLGDDVITNHNTVLQLAIRSNSNKSDAVTASSSGNAESANITNALGLSQSQPEQKTTSADPDASSVDITTAIIWHCTLNANNDWAMLMIDDKSGKLVGISFSSNIFELIAYGKFEPDRYLDSLCAFAQDYYGLPAEAIIPENENSDYDTYGAAPADGSLDKNFIIQLTEESGGAIQMPLKIYADLLMWN